MEIESIKNIIVTAVIITGGKLSWTYPINITFEPDIIRLVSSHIQDGNAIINPYILITNLLNDNIALGESTYPLKYNNDYLPNRKNFSGNFNFLFQQYINGNWVTGVAAGNPSVIVLTFSFIKYKKPYHKV